jgi:hypothetical protein
MLQDAEFHKIEGFPIGSDEDILNLSNPPTRLVSPDEREVGISEELNEKPYLCVTKP